MVKEYRWRVAVRSYEGDAWGFTPTSAVLRYFEQTAVEGAANLGFGDEFHREHNSAWIVRRMNMVMHRPARQGAGLEIVTWASHFGKARGGREYRILDGDSGESLYSGYTEWVYVNRQTLSPMAVPGEVAAVFDVPGAPLGSYEPPEVEPSPEPRRFEVERTAEWHELDSLGHVNNAVYADWLDDALKSAMEAMGLDVGGLKERGLHLRGEYYSLNYKRAAMQGDGLRISTGIEGISGRLWAVRQSVATATGEELLAASSVHGWRDGAGEPAHEPAVSLPVPATTKE
ncbi:MAG: acyl-[acyl-carrier-protein] thioesterase [Chloroflexia bacterium]